MTAISIQTDVNIVIKNLGMQSNENLKEFILIAALGLMLIGCVGYIIWALG